MNKSTVLVGIFGVLVGVALDELVRMPGTAESPLAVAGTTGEDRAPAWRVGREPELLEPREAVVRAQGAPTRALPPQKLEQSAPGREGRPPEVVSPGLRRLAEVAGRMMPGGTRWEAEHGDSEANRAAAQRVLRKMESFDRRLESEPASRELADDILENLNEALADSDSHVQNGSCGKTICRMEIIHESDVAAFRFSPDRAASAGNGWSAEVIADRSEEDGRLMHYIYFRSPEAVPESEKKALAELERQREILAKGTE